MSRIRKDILSIRVPFLFLILYILITQYFFHCFCPMAILTGFPCPACGLTRAACHLLTGDIRQAALENATIFLWVPFLFYLAINRYVIGRKPRRITFSTILLCLATLFYYVARIRTHTLVSVGFIGLIHLHP